ncbi:cytochrome c1, partial [Neisseria gonorrhoeae]
MKQAMKNWFAALLSAVPMSAAFASGGHAHYEKVD